MVEGNILGWASFAAILIGPIVAVYITRIMDQRSEVARRKYEIFRSLMQTRGQQLDPLHVASLNIVEVAFYKCAPVRGAFKAYMQHLNQENPATENASRFFAHRRDLFLDLIHEVGKQVGYSFDKNELERMSYSPIGWEHSATIQIENAELLRDVLKGIRPLPVLNMTPEERENLKLPMPKGGKEG